MCSWVVTLILATVTTGQARPTTIEYDPAWAAKDGRIEVTVLDSGGAPVSDCAVWFAVGPHERGPSVPDEQPTGRTDTAGRIVFTDLAYTGYSVIAKSGGLGASKGFWLKPATSPAQIELKLSVGHSIAGSVRDEKGQPLADVAVVVRGTMLGDRTDDQGRYRLANLDADEAELTFIKPGYGTVDARVLPRENPFTLTMRPGSKVRVTVLDDKGAPVRDARVTYSAANDVWADSTRTDTNGQFITVDLERGTEFTAAVSVERDGLFLNAQARATVSADNPMEVTVQLKPVSRMVRSEAPDPGGVFYTSYYPLEGASALSLAGRIVLKRHPAMATLILTKGQDQGEYKVRTRPDGWFTFDALPEGDFWLRVAPDDATLYDPESVRSITTSADPQERDPAGELIVKLERGGVIEGRVVSAQGKPFSQTKLHLRVSGRDVTKAIWPKQDGTFRFAGVAPSKDPYEVVVVHREAKEPVAAANAGALHAGQTISDVVIQMPPTPADEQIGVVNGIVVTEDGTPVSEVTLELPAEFAVAPAVSDDAGAFTLGFRKAGKAALTAVSCVCPRIGARNVGAKTTLTVVEGGELELGASPPSQPVRVVVRNATLDALGGTITDEEGKPLNSSNMLWYSARRMGTWGNTNGTFFHREFGPEPVLIEIYSQGYQAKVLLEGRDFKRGDVEIHIVLKKGPFAKGTTIFEAVTGFKASERAKLPGGDQLWQHVPEYRRAAGNGDDVFVHVLDAQGQPINTLYVLRWNDTVRGIPDTAAEERLKFATLVGEDGWYAIPTAHVYLWSEGTGRTWMASQDRIELGNGIELTLAPEATVRLQVKDEQGQPVAGASVLGEESGAIDIMQSACDRPFSVDTRRATSADPLRLKAPETDKDGRVVFRHLAAGWHRFRASSEDGRQATITIDLPAGQGVGHTLTLRRVPSQPQGDAFDIFGLTAPPTQQEGKR